MKDGGRFNPTVSRSRNEIWRLQLVDAASLWILVADWSIPPSINRNRVSSSLFSWNALVNLLKILNLAFSFLVLTNHESFSNF